MEELVPNGFYLEIFGRRNNLRDKWVTLGNELLWEIINCVCEFNKILKYFLKTQNNLFLIKQILRTMMDDTKIVDKLLKAEEEAN